MSGLHLAPSDWPHSHRWHHQIRPLSIRCQQWRTSVHPLRHILAHHSSGDYSVGPYTSRRCTWLSARHYASMPPTLGYPQFLPALRHTPHIPPQSFPSWHTTRFCGWTCWENSYAGYESPPYSPPHPSGCPSGMAWNVDQYVNLVYLGWGHIILRLVKDTTFI